MHIIVGSGITGLMCARILLEKKIPGSDILLLEKGQTIGGLLSSVPYPDGGYFDYGIHTLYDTDIQELNAIQRGILPEDEWIFNKDVRRDYGGSYFNGKLQFNSSYVDIRSLPAELKQQCIKDFFDNLLAPKNEEPVRNVYDLLKNKYGAFLAKEVLAPIVEKTFHNTAENLHPFSVNILPLTRIVMFDEQVMDELCWSPKLCSYLAYTEQLKIPTRFIPSKETYYPKAYGMIHVIDALRSYLHSHEVKILTQTEVSGINCKQGEIASIHLRSQNEKQTIDKVDKFYWTGALPQLAGFFPEAGSFAYDKPLKTFIINMILPSPDKLDGMFYAYCFDKNYAIHRASSPYNLCPSSKRPNGFPFSAEMICSGDEDKSQIARRTVDDLLQMGMIATQPSWVDVVHAPVGYPNLTCKNVEGITSLREKVLSYELNNLQLFGSMSKSNLFYQTEILSDIYQTIMG